MAIKNEIVKSVGDTILDSNTDFLVDIGEVGIDFIFDESPLIQLPFVKTVYSIAKTGIAIRDRHLLNKTLMFIKKLNANNLDSEEYEKYKKRLKEKDENIYKELEYVIIILDKMIEKEKSEVLANLYSAYINKEINFNEFKNLSLVLDNFLLYDKISLGILYNGDTKLKNMQDTYGSGNRLISLGLAYNINGYNRSPNGNISFSPPKNDISATNFGKKFYKYGFCIEKYK